MYSSCLRPVALALLAGLLTPAAAFAAAPGPLRVCADPDNLPFSNDRLEGFENKIARLLADDLHTTLEYTWYSQQHRGFLRATLLAGKCDVVIGVPQGYGAVLSTNPYYRSSYVFVSRRSSSVRPHSFDDPTLRSLRIGLYAYGAEGGNAPPVYALSRRGLSRNLVGYSILATEQSPAGKIFQAVAEGDVDVAIVWGPLVGGFLRQKAGELVATAVETSDEQPPLQFAFDISMGVRRDDGERVQQLNEVLRRRSGDIRQVLMANDIPILDQEATVAVAPLAATTTVKH